MPSNAIVPAIAPTATVKRLRWLTLVAVVVPIVMFAALAWHGYVRTLEQARQGLLQTSRIVQEHAAKVFQTNHVLLESATDTSARRDAQSAAAHDMEIGAVLLWSQDYFMRFYSEVAGSASELTITLFRSDGEMIARYPALESASQAYARDSPILNAISEGAIDGIVNGLSEPDGYRLAAFRQVVPYPLYVAVSRTSRSVLAEWKHDLQSLAAIVVPTWLALVVAAMLAFRKARSEHEVILQWHEEEARRAEAEEQLRQLQKYEALGELTGGLAHDFNNLLHIVSSNAAIISLLPRDADLRPHVSAITRAVTSGTALTKHLLAFARKQPLAFERIETSDAVLRICDLARHSLPRSIELKCEVAPDVWDVLADHSELELALLNLTINARDAMPEGGAITVSARNVVAGSAQSGELPDYMRDYVLISVSDTGTGIPEGLLHRIFEPFFTTKKGKGTGLGLSRVYGYARQLGGVAAARNAATGGAAIELYIPRAEDRSTEGQDLTIRIDEVNRDTSRTSSVV
jgi:signal transduction histidine kinase